MVYFLLSAATQYIGPKFRNITVAGKNIRAQCYDIAIHRKKFRLVPFRFVQSEANNARKPDSFKFTPGMSPSQFSKSNKGPKLPLYTRITSERGQMAYMVGLSVFAGATLLICISSSTWNSARVLEYFERPETKIPRKLKGYKEKYDQEAYYLRYDLMLIFESVMSDLRFSQNKKDEIDVYTADTLKVMGHGCLSTNFSGILGIPYFFEWNSADDVDLSKIRHQSSYHFGNYFTDHTLILEAVSYTHLTLPTKA